MIFIDEEKSFQLEQWFDDPDIKVDESEKLRHEIYLEKDDGEKIKVTKNYGEDEIEWIKYDSVEGTLWVNPKSDDIGKHYIRIIASDEQGVKTTASIPLVVNWQNQGPIVNRDGIVEDIIKQKENGIVKIEVNNENTLDIQIDENREVILEIPKNIFVDRDLTINPQD